MKFEKVFVDGNVIIDIFDKQRPGHHHSVEVIRLFLLNKVEMWTSADLITTVYYVLAKINKQKAFSDIKKVMELFGIIPLSDEDIKTAISLMERDKKFKDFQFPFTFIFLKLFFYQFFYNLTLGLFLFSGENF